MKNFRKIRVALLVIGWVILAQPIASATTSIIKIYDGDTITLNSGKQVQLLQIDTPELSQGECYAEQSRAALIKLLKTPGEIALMADPNLDKVDRYGRLLRYIFIGKTNINLKMVEVGAAAPYFYRSERGMYATAILKAAQTAQAKKLGLWKACPGTKLTPNNKVTTLGGAASSATPRALVWKQSEKQTRLGGED